MGKPYASELRALADTYSWALESPIDFLANAVASAAHTPLLTVGSGGSLTAAHFAASLHQRHVGKIGKATTPLEAISVLTDLRSTSVMILSAGGRNPDVIGTLKKAVACEPARVIVVCAGVRSPLTRLAEEYRSIDIVSFKLPSGKDGFLATNSLLAFTVLLARAYAKAFSTGFSFPATLEELIHPNQTHGEFISDLRKRCEMLWRRENLVALYGTATQTAALDVESKFTEAALGAVQTSDYRNFAHGRHHWLAKRGTVTGVLAFETGSDQDIAGRTLRLLPSEVPVSKLKVPGEGTAAEIAALLLTFHVVGLAGEAKGIDPGRPGVPDFGRKIYNLRAFGGRNGSRAQPLESVFIERKAGSNFVTLVGRNEFEFWATAYREFKQRLCSASFRALVCDYDGTLCDGRERFIGLSPEVAKQLSRLLDDGLVLGVATGRGKSAKDRLRSHLPRRLWHCVFVGYYNGSDIGALSDDERPDGSSHVCEALLPVAEALRSNRIINYNCECSYRRMQITVVPKTPTAQETVWKTVQQIVHGLGESGISVLRSSHSFDVIAPGVSKRKLISHISDRLGGGVSGVAVLCIGDRGQYPGNDYELLQEPFSLSVDETSTDPASCWNLAPRGYRGAQAAAFYLRALRRAHGGGARFFLE